MTFRVFLTSTCLVSLILAAAAIEDCAGACAGQENWTAFWVMLGIALFTGLGALMTALEE